MPGAPTLNSASWGNASVTLNWSAPTSNGGSALTGYSIYRGTFSGGEVLIGTASSLATGYTDGGLTNGVTYYYQVTASNLIGESSRSSEKSATPITRRRPALNSATAGNASVTLPGTPHNNGGSPSAATTSTAEPQAAAKP